MELADPFWRLSHLYSCKKEGTGESTPFKMRPEQEEVIRSLHDEPTTPLYIIKARRLGLSTGIGIAMQDFSSWNGGSQSMVIERNEREAENKMRNIIRFSFESMPPEIISRFEIRRKSDSFLEVKVKGNDDKLLSAVQAVITGRGSDCGFLWVSEGAIIAHRDPKRMEEIITGAWVGARKGRRLHETSWMGGKSGPLWAIVEKILRADPDAPGKVLFYPWHNDPVCINLDGGPITADHEDYFRSLAERLGKSFSREQKRWYVVTRAEQGIFMKREYPSTLDEAFSAPVEGAIYAPEIGAAEAERRILPLPVDGNSLVHTFWDLGSPRNTRVLYAQQSGRRLRILRADRGSDETLIRRWSRMQGYGYAYGTHFLPHDAAQTARSGITLETECRELGMNVRVIPRCDTEWTGINHAKGLFASLEFDSEKCREFLDALACFRIGQDNEPVHDDSSHDADALRSMAEAHLHGLFRFNWADVSGAPEDSAVRRRREHRVKPIRVCQ